MFSASSSALGSLTKEERTKLFWGTTTEREHNGLPGIVGCGPLLSKSQGGMTLGEITNMDVTKYSRWRKARRADRSQLNSVTSYDWKVAEDLLANRHFAELNKNRPAGLAGAPDLGSPAPKSQYKAQFARPTREQLMSATDHSMALFKNMPPVGLKDYSVDQGLSRSHAEHCVPNGPGRAERGRPPREELGRVARGEYGKDFLRTQSMRSFARCASAPEVRRKTKAPAPTMAAMAREDVFYETRVPYLAPGR
mmetsp:Transcript_55074/g.144854  ORF Transcript_55074/g.144854 Transcript_55074/m.144854 type:complete len:252 (-) Transcript_55074:8-763(-)